MSDLRSATHDVHAAAEETHISKMLVSGDFTPAEWAAFLSNQYLIRKAIEDRNVIKTELYSAPRILQDLTDLGFNADVKVVSATVQYVSYLQSLDERKLWSHIYALYLGDLYGGQMIKKALQDRLPVSMLTFEDRPSLIAYVRENLADADEAEAVESFNWIIRIYNELHQELRGTHA